jgi:hypothetical protein
MDDHKQDSAPAPAVEKPENPFVSIVFNIAVPAIILSKMSEPERLGPVWALIVAFSFPLGYFIWDYVRRRKANFIAVLGFVSVLLSGGFGLMQLDGIWFAVKEAAIPAVIGVIVLGSMWTKRPLVHMLLYNDKVIDVDKVAHELQARQNTEAFNRLLVKATYLLTASFFVSAVLNFGLAIYLLKSPAGTPEFNQELGQMTAWSYPVIVVPCMIIMMAALWVLISGIKRLTGMELEDIFNQRQPKKK